LSSNSLTDTCLSLSLTAEKEDKEEEEEEGAFNGILDVSNPPEGFDLAAAVMSLLLLARVL
jgi:hypothetical protein